MLPRSRIALSRRQFLSGMAAIGCVYALGARGQSAENLHFNVAEYDHDNILAAATEALKLAPQTITALPVPKKLASPHLYFSEDTEWFATESGHFEHRPGYSNPAAFSQHRDALVRMNGVVAACVAAWRLTSEAKYAQHALSHLRAWFLTPDTRMEPNLDHAACIPPSTDGSYRGIEDTVMLAETVRCAAFLSAYNGPATEDEATALRQWFTDFTTWMNESKPGFIAREMKDRTAICWTLQAAEMARFTRNGALQLDCLHRFREKLLRQMNFDGQFPIELHRPDAYAASIFTLDCLSMTCEAVSSPLDRLWDYNLQDGRGMRSAAAWLFPVLLNRGAWKFPSDAEHFTDWPVRQPSLLLAGRAYSRSEYIALWKRLPLEPKKPELLRTFPMRQPALWTVRPPA